ncbi:MAG: aminoglycoside phosphotransferase family protein [Nostoc sp.]|uniref:aminoglycoside phosphotransferase family protein n=1 Tax=Nostoc sp. TaxID=1180 RepID=UPI002FF96B20
MTINSKSSKGKNNLIFLTVKLPSGRQFFIKQDYHYHNSNISNRVKNEWQFQRFLRNCHDLHFASSLNLEIIHFDEGNSILIYECQKDLIDVQSYYISQKAFPTGIAELMGTSLAYLHRETFISKNCYDFMNKIIEGKSCYQFPYPGHLLDRVAIETLIEEFLPQGFRFLTFYQSSESLRAAVTEVVATYHHCCLTHNNLQLNNILIPIYSEKLLFQAEQSNKTIIKLINWDNCSWGDPAFDLGTAIAGYLLLWLNSLIIHPAILLEQSLQLATIPLEAIQPSIIALTRSYIISFPQVLEECPDFLKRVVQFTGLALIYKIIAMIQSFQDFNNQGICILQLAKTLLCRPEESFKSVFGMTELALNELIVLACVR